MALTNDRQTRIKVTGTARHGRRGVAGGAEIFFGALIGKDADGYLVPASDAAAVQICGISEEHVDNTNGNDGDVKCSYVTGVEAELVNSAGSIGQADTYAFAEDDQTVGDYAASAQKNFVGPVTEFTAAKAWVFVDEAVIAAYYAAIQYADANDATA